MIDKRAHRYFFLHIMKTAGTTFSRHILRNFPATEAYPNRHSEGNMRLAYMDVARLLSQPPERLARARIIHGHFPYAVIAELGLDLVTMTLLRDPVERTLSMLRQLQRKRRWFFRRSLTKTYEHALFNPFFVSNNQTKVFSLSVADGELAMDEQRLRIAKENLAKMDLIGLTERFDDFLEVLRTDYGWAIRDVPRQNVSDRSEEVPASLVERIREDNAFDVALYEYAEALVAERRAARLAVRNAAHVDLKDSLASRGVRTSYGLRSCFCLRGPSIDRP